MLPVSFIKTAQTVGEILWQ